MRGPLVLAFVTALAAQDPAAAPLTLELRVFNGLDEVTPHVRVTVHRAGDRGDAMVNTKAADGRFELQVPQGIYDIQAIHERDGRVLDIRWANRLVVMPYPDENGRHLEVINFKNGFGALEVRAAQGPRPDVTLYPSGKRDKGMSAAAGATSVIFVVPAGTYDLMSRGGGGTNWQSAIDVPLDGTRLWIVR